MSAAAKERDANVAPVYEIRVVSDFLKVPEDRIDECLREFALMLEMSRRTQALLEAVGETVGLTPEQVGWELVPVFKWIDDGLGNVTLTIDTKPDPPPQSADRQQSNPTSASPSPRSGEPNE